MLTGAGYLEGCDFELTGMVTLADLDRNLFVLQDDAGAVALHFALGNTGLQVGQRVVLNGTNCSPYFIRFPDFPHHPSGWELRDTFEAPAAAGEYYLARMRGYLRPPVSGEYSFWIASDNSSELWLSTDSSPARARKIAAIPRFSWVAAREWFRFPSQRSEPIVLQSGKTYYVEALHEQTTVGDHLAVAWQGPGLEHSVIGGRYLAPCGHGLSGVLTDGILREFWTNYSAGDLAEIGGARPFQSALSVETLSVRQLGPGPWPKPDPIVIGQPWRDEINYRWVSTEGLVKFIGARENAVWFEVAGETAQIQVCAQRLDPAFLLRMHNARIEVEGVCEGVYGRNDSLEPGILWVSGETNVHFVEVTKTNAQSATVEHADKASTNVANPAMQGFYSTRGVVTFNDRVLGQDYLVVQEGESAMLVAGGETSFFQRRLKVGEWVDLGGAVQPGRFLPVLAPLIITELGLHALPVPFAESVSLTASANQAGKWSELAGVVHSVSSNGLLSVVGKEGPVCFWIGGILTNELAGYVDAKLRVRGVFWPNALDVPLMLVPSQNHVDVEEPAPDEPFAAPGHAIAELAPEAAGSWLAHRVKLAGEITYRDARTFFLQDASGGIRVLPAGPFDLTTGETVEVLGFASISASGRTLTDALLRPSESIPRVVPRALDLSEPLWARQEATLVVANAALLAQKTNGNSQVLELQEQQRVFTATLPTTAGLLPEIVPGSRLQIVGVYGGETTALSPDGEKSTPQNYLSALNLLLRSPADVHVLSGPPWWTWKRMVILVGALVAVLAITLLWIHLLRRRLERQHAAQLAFSQQVLGKLEEERHRIAVNLHDSLGHTLLVIKNHALVAVQSPAEKQEILGRMSKISAATSQAIEEVRRIAQGLRPSQLDRLGLTEALRAAINRAAENGPTLFACRVDDIDGLFDKDGEIHVFRIVQEAITNVVKHSSATEATVVIKKRETSLSLSVRDNGCGFDPARLSLPALNLGYGLTGVRERVRILGGTLTLDARVGAGTRLTVEVPFKRSTNSREHE